MRLSCVPGEPPKQGQSQCDLASGEKKINEGVETLSSPQEVMPEESAEQKEAGACDEPKQQEQEQESKPADDGKAEQESPGGTDTAEAMEELKTENKAEAEPATAAPVETEQEDTKAMDAATEKPAEETTEAPGETKETEETAEKTKATEAAEPETKKEATEETAAEEPEAKEAKEEAETATEAQQSAEESPAAAVADDQRTVAECGDEAAHETEPQKTQERPKQPQQQTEAPHDGWGSFQTPGGDDDGSGQGGATYSVIGPIQRPQSPADEATADERAKAKATHRELAVKELIDTEQTYYGDLLVVMSVFMEPLDGSKGNSLITQQEFRDIFSNFSTFPPLHADLLWFVASHTNTST